MKQKLTIFSIGSFLLGVIGIIVFILNKEYLGASAVVRQTHDAYAKHLGELSSGVMNTIAIIGIIVGIIFLILGVFLLLKSRKNN